MMMSDLAEIAAAAGIAIIDSDVADGDETDNKQVSDQIREWDIIFSSRYTDSDPEYADTVEKSEVLNKPPCVTGFNCWRNRSDNRNWNRDRRDRGRYNNRGNQHDRWNSPSGDRGGNWGRNDRQQQGLQNYGDYHQRGYGDQHRPHDNDRQSWGNNSSQNRSSGGYNQHRESHHSRNDGGDSQNRRYENQRQRDGSRGGNRDRSPQR